MSRRAIRLKGLTAGTAYPVPDVAPSGEALFYLDAATMQVMLSVDGGAAGVVESSGAGGDTLTIGADVTLQRSAANVLTIPESVVMTNAAAAVVGLTINAHATQSAETLLVQSSGGTDWFSIGSTGLVQVGTGVTPAYQLEVSGAVNDVLSSSIRLKNTNAGTTTGTAAGVTCETATSSGYLRAYHAGFTGTSAYADAFVLLAQSDAAHLVLAAEAGAQEIRFRVPTTGQILSLGAAALTVAEGANFVFGTTTGSSLGAAANQKTGMHGAAVVQVAGTVQTFATADGTHAARTGIALTLADGVGTNDGTIGAITADASVIAAIQELAAQINANRVDLADTAAFANHIADGLQLKGLFA